MATSVTGVTNHFPSAEDGFTTTTSGSVASAATTVGLNSVSGYTNGEVVVLVIDPTDASKKQVFTGIVDTSGVQITSVVWTAGTNQTHALGATVVDYETATHWSMMSKGILEHANQQGEIDADKIVDSNRNEVVKFGETASAVNEVTLTNSATGDAVEVSATGDDTNVDLNLVSKGSGEVTFNGKKIQNPYGYRAGRTTTQSIPDVTLTTVEMDSVLFDPNNDYDNTTYIYTAPVTGYYQAGGTIRYLATADGDLHYIYLHVNDVNQSASTNQEAGTFESSTNISDILYMEAGDEFKFKTYHLSGSTESLKAGAIWNYAYCYLVHEV